MPNKCSGIIYGTCPIAIPAGRRVTAIYIAVHYKESLEDQAPGQMSLLNMISVVM